MNENVSQASGLLEDMGSSSMTKIAGGTPAEPEKESKVDRPVETLMDKVSAEFENAITDGLPQGQVASVKKDVSDVIRTIMAMNSVEEYAHYLRASNQSYPIADYEVERTFKVFVGPTAVKIVDDELANDLIDREAYRMTHGKVLNPDEFYAAEVRICKRLKLKVEVQKAERSLLLLTSAVNDGAMINGKVHSSTQDRIVPLRNCGLFDSQYYSVSVVGRWARHHAADVLALSVKA